MDEQTQPTSDSNPDPQPPAAPASDAFGPVPAQPESPVPAEQPVAPTPVQIPISDQPSAAPEPTPSVSPTPAAEFAQPAAAPDTPPADPNPLITEALNDPSLNAPQHVVGAVFSPSADGTNTAPTAQVATRRKGKGKLFVLIAGVLVVLLGGSAAAYYGYYLPNKPDDKLAAAFANLAGQKQLNMQGTIDVTSSKKSSDFPGVAVNFNLGADLANAQLAVNGTVGVSGTQFPFDVRYVNKDIYFKLGGLDLISKAVPTASSSVVGPYLQALSTINNQWYVVDSSFLNDFGAAATCTANLSFALTPSDVNKIETAYEKDPLFKVTDTSSAEVGNVATTKMDLSPATDQTANAFASQLNSLSVVQNIHKCLGNSSASSQVDKAITPVKNSANNGSESLAVYVTADKQIKKLEFSSTDTDTVDAISLTVESQPPTIVAPSGAKPIQDLLSAFLGTSDLSGLSGLSN
jgi:hypothetical protein